MIRMIAGVATYILAIFGIRQKLKRKGMSFHSAFQKAKEIIYGKEEEDS